MNQSFTESLDARILVGQCVPEAEALLRDILIEAEALTDEEKRDFVMKILRNLDALEVVAYIIAYTHSGLSEILRTLLCEHDTANKMTNLMATLHILTNADHQARQSVRFKHLARVADELLGRSPKKRQKMIDFIETVQGGAIIANVLSARGEAARLLAQKIVSKKVDDRLPVDADPLVRKAAEFGLGALQIRELNILLHSRKLQTDVANLVSASWDGDQGVPRHWSWNDVMTDLMSADQP